MQKTAAPLKKGMHLYMGEKGKILTFVVVAAGPKFGKIQPGRSADPTKKWTEIQIQAVSSSPGVWEETVDRGVRERFFQNLDEVREKMFRSSLRVLQTGSTYTGVPIEVSKLQIDTLKMMARDLGVTLDLGILSQQPVDS